MDCSRLDRTFADRSSAAFSPEGGVADFLAWNARESAPDEIFEQLMGERTRVVPSRENLFTTAQATRTVITFKQVFSWIERGFLCFLMEPRMFAMQTRAPKAKGSVLGSVDQGASSWKARAAQAVNKFGVAMEPEDEETVWSKVFRQDYSESMDVDVVAAPPCVRRTSEPQPKRGERVGIYSLPKLCVGPTPLLPSVAKRAFHRMSMHQMKSLVGLFDGFEWPKPKPRQELDVRMVLMSHIPTMAVDLELDSSIVDWKGAVISKPKWSSMFTNVSTAIETDLLEPDDASDLQKSVLRFEDAAKQRHEARFKLHPDKKAMAKPRKTILGTADTAPLSRDEAKVDLRKHVGVAIDKGTTLHLRWKASYPNASAPFALCKVWNAVMSAARR